MKLSKKIMLFEEFTEVKAETRTDVDIKGAQDASIRTEIASDVDTIINKLEDLANNLGKEEVAHEGMTNESLVQNLLSAELYMIPVIAAGIAGTAALGAGVGATILIKNIINKKKIRSKYNKTVKKNRMTAAKMELYVKSVRDYKKQDVDDKSKKKIEEFKKKIEELRNSADDVNNALLQKHENYKEFIGNLNAETRMEIAEMMLASKDLSDTEKERYKKTYQSTVKSLNARLKKAEEEKKKAEEAAAKASDAEKENIEKRRAELEKEVNSKDDNLQNSEESEEKDN